MVLMTVLVAPSAIASDAAVPAGDAKILGIEEGEDQASVLFAAPPELTTRTLTADDVDLQVDGAPEPARVRRLSASDLEIALVIDTTVAADDLRALQAALVEFVLTLPPGATMRTIDATGTVSRSAPVPGPAIAAIRDLRPTGDDDMAKAVGEATRVLDESPRGRTALLAVGRGLASRMDVVDDRSMQSLSYLISIGPDQAGQLLGPRAPGEVVEVDTPGDVLAATDDIASDLRMLYLARVDVPEGGAQTITFAINAADGATQATTFQVDSDRVRPTVVQPDVVEQPDDDQANPDQPPDADRRPATEGQAQASTGDAEPDGWDQWWVVLIGAAAVVMAALLLRPLLFRRPTTTLPAPLPPLPPAHPEAPQRRRATQGAARPQRPIVKLSPETREALARAHRGLRQLALASRETASTVPDDLFRLTEARASAALSGYDRPLDATLHAAVSNDSERDSVVVHRAAKALSAGWRHTARQQTAPPAVVEMNALLSGTSPNRTRRRPVPVAPVRALNPLVEIGLEHMILAAQPEEYAALAARAVTAVDLMRAARLARPVLAISPFLLTDVERYRAACSADPTEAIARDDWLQFLCDGITERSYVAIDQLHQLRRLRTQYREVAHSKLSLRLLDLLLAQPVVATPLIATRLAVSVDEAQSVAETARDAGWLTPHPEDPDEGDVWLAGDILAVFTSTATSTGEALTP